MKTTAGELRKRGFNIPDNIPDCATTELNGYGVGTVSAGHDNSLQVDLLANLGPFEWVSATVVAKGPDKITLDKTLWPAPLTLDHVQQRTPTECLSACIAMITRIPIDRVVADFHERYRRDWTVNVSTYFNEIGLKHTVRSAVDRVIEEGFVYTARVSSLNNIGGGHAVVIHNCPDAGFTVYDPNKGRPDTRYYEFVKTDDPLSETLTSYITTTQIAEQDLRVFWAAQQEKIE